MTISNDELLAAYIYLFAKMKSKVKFGGRITHGNEQAMNMIIAALLAFSHRHEEVARSICNLFASEQDFQLSLRKFISDRFSLSDAQSLDND